MARFSVPAGSGGGDVSFSEEGCIVFPNDGEICNIADSSGDGYGYSTISIVPDKNLESDQYLIIDPTAPNHIHIRAGGTQDNSSAELILGGEQANVNINDNAHQVSIRSTGPIPVVILENNNPTTPSDVLITSNSSNVSIGWVVYNDLYKSGNSANVTNVVLQGSFPSEEYLITVDVDDFFVNGNTYYFYDEVNTQQSDWTFGNDGYLYGPVMGLIQTPGIVNQNPEAAIGVFSLGEVVIGGLGGGEFLNDSFDPNNQIATIGDIADTVSGEVSYTVGGGTLGTQPTFTGDPLFSGSYVKVGKLVHFQVQVDMDNITSFGTGQYYVTLPFDAAHAYAIREGCIHDISTGNQYAILGHVVSGSNQLNLFFTNSNGQDEAFDYNSPFTLDQADNFHISGSYICE